MFISVLGRGPGEARRAAPLAAPLVCCLLSELQSRVGGPPLSLQQVMCGATQRLSQAGFPAARGPVCRGHQMSARPAPELPPVWGSEHALRTDRKILVLRFGKFARGQLGPHGKLRTQTGVGERQEAPGRAPRLAPLFLSVSPSHPHR